MQDRGVEVLLGVNRDLLRPLGVVEIPFVVTAAAFGRIRFDARDVFLRRKFVRRLVIVVVDRADDERAVGIAFEKLDYRLLSDARNELSTPTLARPHLRATQLA